MSPSLALLGDIGSDHDGSPPTPAITASPAVFLHGNPVALPSNSDQHVCVKGVDHGACSGIVTGARYSAGSGTVSAQ